MGLKVTWGIVGAQNRDHWGIVEAQLGKKVTSWSTVGPRSGQEQLGDSSLRHKSDLGHSLGQKRWGTAYTDQNEILAEMTSF